MRVNPVPHGFSLVEVATSIGVIAFALVALLGVFPLGLENSRLCVSDTRATQIIKTIAATLESETFAAADCFCPTKGSLPPVNFETKATENTTLSDKIFTLYASYDVNALPRLVRATTPPADAIYRVDVRCRGERFVPVSTGTATPATAFRISGIHLNLQVAGLREKKSFTESWIFLPNITRP